MRLIQILAILWYLGVTAYTIITGDSSIAIGVLIGRAISVSLMEDS